MDWALRMIVLGLSISSGYPVVASEIEQVTVTARKREELLFSVPLNLTVVGGPAIETFGRRNIGDVSAYVPNFVVSGGIGGELQGDMTLRGVSTLVRIIGVDSGLGVFIDGAPVGRPEAFSAPLFDVARIEFTKGPQGTLFGRNTIAGAINIVTEPPTLEPSGYGVVESGRFNLARTKVVVSGGSGPIAVRLSGYAESRRGFYENKFDQTSLENLGSYGLRAQLSYSAAAADASISLDTSKHNTRPAWFQTALGFAADQSAQPYTTNRNRKNTLDKTVQGAAVTLNAGEDRNLTSITSLRRTRYNATLDDDSSAFDVFFSDWTDRTTLLSQEIRFTGEMGLASFTVGGYGERQRSKSNRPYLTGADFPIPLTRLIQDSDLTSQNLAIFGETDVPLGRDLSLSVGGRLSHDSKDVTYSQIGIPLAGVPNIPRFSTDYDKWFLTPSVSLSWAPSNHVNAFARVARGYKSGGFNTDFVQNSDIGVAAEHVTSYDLGLRGNLSDGRIRYTLSGFWLDYKSLQVSQIVNAQVVLTNAADARSRGIEFEGDFNLFDGLKLGGNLGFTDADYRSFPGCPALVPTDCSGKRLRNSPRFTSSLNLVWTRRVGEFDATTQVDFTHRGARYFDSRNDPRLRAAGYQTVNLSADLKFGPYKISGWITNIFDERFISYMDERSIFGQVNAFYDLPRVWGISLRRDF
jgi:iron complex outermembrane recepter protein